MLEPAYWGLRLGHLHLHLCRHAHRGHPYHPLQGAMSTPCCTVLCPDSPYEKGWSSPTLRCTSWTCLEDIMGTADIRWFVQAVDDSGEFGMFKLMDNLVRFQRFAGQFRSYQQAMALCLFQLVHWHFVPHGPRSAHCLRASMLVLDNLTSPEHAHQFSRLVMYTVDKVYLHQTMGPPLTHIACRSLREQY